MDICWAYEGARVYPGPTGANAPRLGPGMGMRRPGFPDPDYVFGFDPADYVLAPAAAPVQGARARSAA